MKAMEGSQRKGWWPTRSTRLVKAADGGTVAKASQGEEDATGRACRLSLLFLARR